MSRSPVSELPGDSAGASTRWLLDYLPALLRLATVLTGDPEAAARVVSSALAREARRPTGPTEFAEARLRALVVRQYLASDHDSSRERLSRASLALRHLDGLTLAETAAVVDRPVGVVAGLAQDELDPIELRRSLSRIADAAPDARPVLDRLGTASRVGDRSRRRRVKLVALLAALVALLVLLPTVVLPRLPGDTRTAGDWTLVHRVKPPRGWVVIDHLVAPTYEATDLRPSTGPTDPGVWCRIQVSIPGGLDLDSLPAQRDPVRVHGREAFFSDGVGAADVRPFLAWSYARNAWATVGCSSDDVLDRTKLMSLALSVSFRRTQISLPFKLDTVPSGYRIESATQGLLPTSADVVLAKSDLRPGDANMTLSYDASDSAVDDVATQTVRINGRAASLSLSSTNPRLCLDSEGPHVCISAYWPLGAWPVPAPVPVDLGPVLISTAQHLELAPALADPSTWFPAPEALPAA